MRDTLYLIEITYHESGNSEVTTLKTDDLAWSMNQYQRNRLPFTWEILDVKEKLPTLDDVELIQQGIENYKNDNS